MDYPYFTAAPQHYPQYVNLPPTPAHTATHDEFERPNDPFDFQTLDTFNPYAQNLHLAANPPTPLTNDHTPSSGNAGLPNGLETNPESNDDTARRTGSNSDENDDESLTPAQSRRKAQNRAAQRAFRERKERHVKDLEAKLTDLEKTSQSITEENALLKLQLQRTSTENEILKATSHISRQAPPSVAAPTNLTTDVIPGPMRYSPTAFYDEVLKAHDNKFPSHRVVVSESGERLLAAGAMWDYIVQHELYIRGLVDVTKVCEFLRGKARCDGQGPVFEEKLIREAIENSLMGSDELL